MASAVVALQQTVDERAAAALDQRVRIAQLEQPVPEAASSERAGAAADLMQGNSCGEEQNGQTDVMSQQKAKDHQDIK